MGPSPIENIQRTHPAQTQPPLSRSNGKRWENLESLSKNFHKSSADNKQKTNILKDSFRFLKGAKLPSFSQLKKKIDHQFKNNEQVIDLPKLDKLNSPKSEKGKETSSSSHHQDIQKQHAKSSSQKPSTSEIVELDNEDDDPEFLAMLEKMNNAKKPSKSATAQAQLGIKGKKLEIMETIPEGNEERTNNTPKPGVKETGKKPQSPKQPNFNELMEAKFGSKPGKGLPGVSRESFGMGKELIGNMKYLDKMAKKSSGDEQKSFEQKKIAASFNLGRQEMLRKEFASSPQQGESTSMAEPQLDDTGLPMGNYGPNSLYHHLKRAQLEDKASNAMDKINQQDKQSPAPSLPKVKTSGYDGVKKHIYNDALAHQLPEDQAQKVADDYASRVINHTEEEHAKLQSELPTFFSKDMLNKEDK